MTSHSQVYLAVLMCWWADEEWQSLSVTSLYGRVVWRQLLVPVVLTASSMSDQRCSRLQSVKRIKTHSGHNVTERRQRTRTRTRTRVSAEFLDIVMQKCDVSYLWGLVSVVLVLIRLHCFIHSLFSLQQEDLLSVSWFCPRLHHWCSPQRSLYSGPRRLPSLDRLPPLIGWTRLLLSRTSALSPPPLNRALPSPPGFPLSIQGILAGARWKGPGPSGPPGPPGPQRTWRGASSGHCRAPLSPETAAPASAATLYAERRGRSRPRVALGADSSPSSGSSGCSSGPRTARPGRNPAGRSTPPRTAAETPHPEPAWYRCSPPPETPRPQRRSPPASTETPLQLQHNTVLQFILLSESSIIFKVVSVSVELLLNFMEGLRDMIVVML